MYFVVMFTVGEERVLFYTVARILDTGGGVIIALLITILLPSKYDKENGLCFFSLRKQIAYAFHSYLNKNQIFREKEQENFGTEKKDK